MTEKEAIEILKDMNDGYTFQACRICVSDNKFNEKQGICESKTCEYLNAIETVIQALKQKDKEIQELKADLYECNNIISDYIDTVKEKDKIIDLMTEDIFNYKCLTYVDDRQFRACKKGIIGEYKEKVRGEKMIYSSALAKIREEEKRMEFNKSIVITELARLSNDEFEALLDLAKIHSIEIKRKKLERI